jgi:uncharacterized protein (TIGR00369 family)
MVQKNSSNPSIILQEIADVFHQIPFNNMLGLTLDAIEDDHIVTSFKMKNELIGNFMFGILHGGVISSVLDVAGGVAAMIATSAKKPHQTLDELSAILAKTSTINLQVNYLRPGKGEIFTTKAWVQQSGNTITFTRMEMQNEAHLIATGTAAYKIG